MKINREKLIFLICLAFCAAGFLFGSYYCDEISPYIKYSGFGGEAAGIAEKIRDFLVFYFESAKLQLLIFICGFTIFAFPAGVFILLYLSVIYGAVTALTVAASATFNNSSLIYTLAATAALYIYSEMVVRSHSFSMTARTMGTGLGALAVSRATRSYAIKFFLLSSFTLAAEISRYFLFGYFTY